MESVLVDPIPWNIFPVDVTNLLPPIDPPASNSDSPTNSNSNAQQPTSVAAAGGVGGAAATTPELRSIPPLFRSAATSLLVTASTTHEDDLHTVEWLRPTSTSRNPSSSSIGTSGESAEQQQQQQQPEQLQQQAPSVTIDTLDEQILSQRIEGLLCGVSSFVIAVGNSGGGPRAVMVGTPEIPGLIPRACEILLSRLKVQSVARVHNPVAVATSFVALLPTRVIDLCDPNNLSVRVSQSREGYLVNAKRRMAETPDDALDTLDEGLETERALIEAGELPACGACATVFSVMFTSNTGTAASLVFVLLGAVRSPQNRSAIDNLMSCLQITRDNMTVAANGSSSSRTQQQHQHQEEQQQVSGAATAPAAGSENSQRSNNNNNNNSVVDLGGSPSSANYDGGAMLPTETMVPPPELLQTSPLTKLLMSVLRPFGTWVVDCICAFEATDGVAAVAAKRRRKMLEAAAAAAGGDGGSVGASWQQQQQDGRIPTLHGQQQPTSLPVQLRHQLEEAERLERRSSGGDGEEQQQQGQDAPPPPRISVHHGDNFDHHHRQHNVDDEEEAEEEEEGDDDGGDAHHHQHRGHSAAVDTSATHAEPPTTPPLGGTSGADDFDGISDLRDRSTALGDEETEGGTQLESAAGGGGDGGDGVGGGVASPDGRADQPADVMSNLLGDVAREQDDIPVGASYASQSVPAALDALHVLLQLMELAHFPLCRPLHDTIETVAFAPKRKRHPHRAHQLGRSDSNSVMPPPQQQSAEQEQGEEEGESSTEQHHHQSNDNSSLLLGGGAAGGGSLSAAAAAHSARITTIIANLDAEFEQKLDEFMHDFPMDEDESCVPLPLGWEAQFTAEGQKYYVDHVHRTTSWDDPRDAYLTKQPQQQGGGDGGSGSGGDGGNDQPSKMTRMVFRDAAAISGAAPVAPMEPASPVAVLLVRPVEDTINNASSDGSAPNYGSGGGGGSSSGLGSSFSNIEKVEMLLAGETCSSVDHVPKEVLEELITNYDHQQQQQQQQQRPSDDAVVQQEQQQQQHTVEHRRQETADAVPSSSVVSSRRSSRGPLTVEEAYNVLWSQPLDGSSPSASHTSAARRQQQQQQLLHPTLSSSSQQQQLSAQSQQPPQSLFVDTDEDIEEIVAECEAVLRETKRLRRLRDLATVEMEEMELGSAAREGTLRYELSVMHKRAVHAETQWLAATNALKEAEAAREHDKQRADEVHQALIERIKELEALPAPKPLSADESNQHHHHHDASVASIDSSSSSAHQHRSPSAADSSSAAAAAAAASADSASVMDDHHSILSGCGSTTAERFVVSKLRSRLRKAESTIVELRSIIDKYRQMAAEGPAIVAATSLESPHRRLATIMKVRCPAESNANEAAVFALGSYIRNALQLDAEHDPNPQRSEIGAEIAFVEASVGRMLSERESLRVEAEKHRDTLLRVPDMMRDLLEKQQTHIRGVRSALENQHEKTKNQYEEKILALKRLHEISVADVRADLRQAQTKLAMAQQRAAIADQQAKAAQAEADVAKARAAQAASTAASSRTVSAGPSTHENTPVDNAAVMTPGRKEDIDVQFLLEGGGGGGNHPENNSSSAMKSGGSKRRRSSSASEKHHRSGSAMTPSSTSTPQVARVIRGGKPTTIPVPDFSKPLFEGVESSARNFLNQLRPGR